MKCYLASVITIWKAWGQTLISDYYDTSGRLKIVKQGDPPVIIAEYDYDDNGNRLSYTGDGPPVTGTYDFQDRLSEYGDYRYTYSNNGELKIRERIGTGEKCYYTYDELGNLLQVQDESTSTTITYLIDGMNRRVGRNDGTMKRYLYMDALNPVAELDAGGNVVSLFIYGTKMNVPDYMIRYPKTVDEKTYRILHI